MRQEWYSHYEMMREVKKAETIYKKKYYKMVGIVFPLTFFLGVLVGMAIYHSHL